MAIGNVLRETRGERSQQKLSLDLNVSREAVSAYETGRAAIPRDVAARIAKITDEPKFAFEIASEYTGGAWTGWLDGVDLHRSAVKEKSLEELEEAIELIRSTSLVNRPDQLSQMEKEKIRKVLIESIDVVVCLSHLVAVLCQEFQISWTGIWGDHRRKLEERGYLKKKKSAPQSAR